MPWPQRVSRGNKSAKTRHGNTHLKRVLGVAALSAIRTKDTYYSVFYRRIAARRGGKRALVAVMHKIVIAIWHVLKHKTAFRDLGADYLPKRDPKRAMRCMRREANNLVLTIRFDPIPQPARQAKPDRSHSHFRVSSVVKVSDSGLARQGDPTPLRHQRLTALIALDDDLKSRAGTTVGVEDGLVAPVNPGDTDTELACQRLDQGALHDVLQPAEAVKVECQLVVAGDTAEFAQLP